MMLLVALGCGDASDPPEPTAGDPWLAYSQHPLEGGGYSLIVTRPGGSARVVIGDYDRIPDVFWAPGGAALAILSDEEAILHTLEVVILGDSEVESRHRLSESANSSATRWSSDGRYLAFEEHVGPGSVHRVRLYDAETREMRARLPLRARQAWAWQPAGHRIAGGCEEDRFALCVVDADDPAASPTSVLPTGTSTAAIGGAAPWSPDGRWLTFIAGSPGSATDVFLADASGARSWRIGSHTHEASAPSFGHDHRHLTFVDRPPEAGDGWDARFLFVLDDEGQPIGDAQLVASERARLVWLADGRVIAVDDDDRAGRVDVTWMAPRSDGVEILATFGHEGDCPWAVLPAVEPESGAMLLACGEVGATELDLLYWPADTDGEPVGTGLTTPSHADHRGWSPTGDRYAFVLAEDRRSGPLHELDATTGGVSSVIHDLARRWPPFSPLSQPLTPWTPDGSAYAFVVRRGGLLVRRPASGERVTVVEPDDTYSLVLFGFAPPAT